MRTVDELIDQHNGSWDEQLIKDIFLPIDANNILAIPLSPHLQEDFVAWHNSRTRIFLLNQCTMESGLISSEITLFTWRLPVD